MKRTSLLRIIVSLAFVLCLAGMLLLSSCGEKVSDIYISSENSPRLTYVQGQDLDLSNGILTIVLDGQEEKVPLSSEEVTVSGYDKATLGTQTLTVTYGEHATSLVVTVIPRIVAEGYEQCYFVGDTFDKEMGKLKIANDDANIFYVNMKDERVKLLSFSSNTAGTVQATVSYTQGSNTYECSFDVTIYEHSNITFTPPQKTNYLSHDKGIKVAGGFFTVVSADGKLTKNVPLKEEMVKNFDLSEATMDHRKAPLEKMLIVEYLPGKTFEYKIKITYSDVSVVTYYATEQLANIQWPTDGSNLVSALTSMQREAALEAINAYYDLSDADKMLLDTDIKETIARAAAVVVNDLFQTALKDYSESFYVSETQQFILSARTLEEISKLAAELDAPTAPLTVYADLLRDLVADFADVVVTGDKDIKTLVSVYSKEQFNYFVSTLNHMINVYTTMKDIPDSWKVEDLEQYATAIEAATNLIVQSNYYSIKSNFYHEAGSFYTEILSKWRTNDDFFDIIWSYYLYIKEDGNEHIRTKMFGPVPMPQLLEEWYANLTDAIYLINYYSQNYSGSAALSDVSQFMYYYLATVESVNAIKASEDPFVQDIYEAFNGDYSTRSYIHTASFGYLYHAGALIDSSKYTGFWSNYYSLLKLYLKNEFSAEANKDMLVATVTSFQSFSPAELYSLLSSLNLMYGNLDRAKMDEGGNTENYYMLSYTTDKAYSIFTLLLRDYYSTYLTEANQALFTKLLRAMENYAMAHVHPVALERFNTLMTEFVAEFDALSQADKDNFIEHFGTSYAQYRAIWEISNKQTSVQLTDEEQALLDRLYLVLDRYNNLLKVNGEQANKYSGILFALYAEAREAYNAFMEIASDQAKNYLFGKTYQIMENELTLDTFFLLADATATSALVNEEKQLLTENGKPVYVTAWDLFDSYDIDKLLSDMHELLYYAYDIDAVTLTDEYVAALIARVSSLSKLQLQIFQFMGSSKVYYAVLTSYFQDKVSEQGQEIADKLIQAEMLLPNLSAEEAQAMFADLMAVVSQSYDSLSESDKALLQNIYDNCMEEYNKLSTDN